MLKDLLRLSKPRLSLLVVGTAAVGMLVAPGHLDTVSAALVLLCTAMIVGAANAVNSYMERDVDALMARTKDRPLAAGRLPPKAALLLAACSSALALPALWHLTNPRTAGLAALAFAVYVGLYTPLKRRSAWALVVGAVPGAIPPLLGYTAKADVIDLTGLALFILLFAWQLPHFAAVSLYLKDDYARADLKVFARAHSDRGTRAGILAFAGLLLPASLALLATPHRLQGGLYAAVALTLGSGLWVFSAAGVRAEDGVRWARRVFLATIAYLTLLMVGLAAAGVRA
ncbi:MAG: protoheme IX farnesyltransferase [Deltaproteobacteria bacterium]|nr:protoheme IX farnesyltransferase [Deltaproteobacteria bacterium]